MDTVLSESALNQKRGGKGRKRRKKIKKKGRKEIPDVNSKVCPAPVCGHWSFVYLPLLKPLPPAAALGKQHNKAREFSEALQSSTPTSARRCCCSLSQEHTVNLTGWKWRRWWRCVPDPAVLCNIWVRPFLLLSRPRAFRVNVCVSA